MVLFFREITRGRAFYMITATELETRSLCNADYLPYIGKYFVVFEPEHISELYSTPVIEMVEGCPLIPIDNKIGHIFLNDIISFVGRHDKEAIRSFMLESKIELSGAMLQRTCEFQFCDG